MHLPAFYMAASNARIFLGENSYGKKDFQVILALLRM